jgi:SAM-dependent methyltransferase
LDSIKPGDFSKLASTYAESRPGYRREVVQAALALLPRPIGESTFADVGAGTGIFTRLLGSFSPAEIFAIEPCDEMRQYGRQSTVGLPVTWLQGAAESTGLPANSCDLVSMASSFHWAKTEPALAEFLRILKPGGLFIAIWNPRLLERNPQLGALEDMLFSRFGLQKRVSSGNSGITTELTEVLQKQEGFGACLYIESEETIGMSNQRYLEIWRSVNDVRAQLGEAKFQDFLTMCEEVLEKSPALEVTYRTRAWVAVTTGIAF